MSYTALEFASSFSSEQCPEGIVAIAENTLRYFDFHTLPINFRILALEKLGAVFNQVSYPLKYTPRKHVVHKQSGNFIFIETEHAAFTEKAKRKRREELAEEIENLAKDADEKAIASEMADSIRNYAPDETVFGAPRAQVGKWASAVRMISARNGETLCHYELPEGEAAFSISLVQFRSQHDAVFVLVGCAIDLQLRPRVCNAGCIYTFLLTQNGARFEFIHRTLTDEVSDSRPQLFLTFIRLYFTRSLKKG